MPSPARLLISAALLAVAIAGIVVQARILREDAFLGIPTLQTRVTIAAYALVGIYAAISIVARLRGSARKR